jgi:hypothetical protein
VPHKNSRPANGVVGIVLHKCGTLRLHRDKFGSLHAEVVGFHTGEGREFLQQLHELGEIVDEIMCCDDPVATRAPWNVEPTRHERRQA